MTTQYLKVSVGVGTKNYEGAVEIPDNPTWDQPPEQLQYCTSLQTSDLMLPAFHFATLLSE